MRLSIFNSFLVYYFKTILQSLIYRLSLISCSLLIIAIFFARVIKRYVLQKYIFLSICFINKLLLLKNLLLQCKLQKLTSTKFYLLLLFDLSKDLDKLDKLDKFYELYSNSCCYCYATSTCYTIIAIIRCCFAIKFVIFIKS